MSRVGTGDLLHLGAVLGALGAVAMAVQASGLRWQHTGSLPRGLYKIDRDAPIKRGSIVLWCLDEARGRWARTRGYLTRGPCPGEVEPLGKVVLGLPGDTIDWTPSGVILNGSLVPRTVAALRDRFGQPIEATAFGRYILAPGTAWLSSPYTARSFDSRYVGPVRMARQMAVVHPMLTEPIPRDR